MTFFSLDRNTTYPDQNDHPGGGNSDPAAGNPF